MIRFSLPNFYENFQLNTFMVMISKIHAHTFKVPDIAFIAQHGTFPYWSWNGGCNSNVGSGAYYDNFLNISQKGAIPLRLNCANVLLEDYDWHDPMGQAILKTFDNGGTMIEFSSIPLMEKISQEYPNYYFMFSKNADLINEFTPEILTAILELPKVKRVGIPDAKNKDFEWLKSLPHKGKCEITVNPICPTGCAHLNVCLLKEHQNQIEYSNQQITHTCMSCYNYMDLAHCISLEEIASTYSKMGFIYYTFATQYKYSQEEMFKFYLNYFIKPECHAEIIQAWEVFKRGRV